MAWTTVVVAVLAGGAGVAAGVVGRGLVGRLRRGAVVAAPGCEVVTGAAWAAVGGAAATGALPVAWLPVLLALTWFGAAAGAVDLARRRLPDALTLPALPAALVLVAPLGAAALGRAVVVAALAAAAHAAVRLVAPSALGGGDVKLAAPLGAVLGAVSWPAVVLAAAVAALATAALAVVLRRRSVPHGPSMLLATALVAAAGAAGAG